MVLILVLALCGTSGWAQPVITNQPQTQAVGPGQQVTFTVGACGTEPLACQWQRNIGAGFTDMAGCTNLALVLTNVQSWDAWDYRVVVTNPGGAQTSAVAHLYVLCPGLLTNREAIDDFADNRFTGKIEGRGSVLERNAQFSVLGNFPLPTQSMYDSYVIAGYPKTWTVSDGTTREWRAELVGLAENGTNTAILTVGSDTGAGYIFHKGQEFVFLLKWSASGSYCFLSCDRVALTSTNAILVLALTRLQANLVLTTRVLDNAEPNTVLYEHSVVDTPGADPTLSAMQFQALTGIPLNDVAPDAPGTPPMTDAVWLGVFQYTDGRQPVPKATFDNLSVWTYQVPTTRFVDAGSVNPTPPYTNWASAASSIQDAVDAAAPGDEVVVTNGIYATGGRTVGTNLLVNRVVVDKPLTLRSVNGPQFTVIQGCQMFGTIIGDGAIRCVYLTNGANLSGFTLTNGATRDDPDGDGGGVRCASPTAVLSNCVLAGNAARWDGGGAYGGTLNNCSLIGNWARNGGGGAAESVLNHCRLTGNSATRGYSGGGGAYGGTLNNCTLNDNYASLWGGGAIMATLNHCLLTGNSAGGWGGGANRATLNNCTITGNSAGRGGGADGGTLNNCILYFNTATNAGANYYLVEYGGILNYCCTTPMPTNGVGNITNAPLFVDYAGGNFRLQTNSSCINAGHNAHVPGATDFDGHPRIVGGTVDMGAYEFQSPSSAISYAWLQQYELPVDGSADLADGDADRMNNWQEWRCQTVPTNGLSVLRLLSAAADGIDLKVTWQSVAGVEYFLERSTNLSASPSFTLVVTNISGQPGTTSLTDSNAGSLPQIHYRVGVRD